MKTFSIYTLGCKVNAYESEFYRQSMIEAGFSEVLPKEPSDIVIINTCTVTNSASFKSRQRIHQAKRLNPNAFVVVVGCYVQVAHETLKEKYEIDLLVGASHKKELVHLITEKIKHVDYQYPSGFEAMKLNAFSHQKRAYVKIQDGCNQFCSYCIIPFARGRERSLPFEEVIEQVKQFKDHHEIVLTGIHTGRYGLDINRSLTELIKTILSQTNVERIRISSIEITEIDDELIELMKTEKRMAKHLHIPLQSAHNDLLKSMNRPYTIEEFKDRCDYIKSEIPEMHISTDFIVGFPGESDEIFEEELETLKNLNLGFMHVFPYSERENTKAIHLKNKVHGTIKKQRVSQLVDLSETFQEQHLNSLINQSVEVLFESYENGYLFGYTANYEPCVCEGGEDLINQLHSCTVKSAQQLRLLGELNL